MCGRFTLTLEAEDVKQELDLGVMPADWAVHYNVAPSQSVAVVIEAAERKVERMRWGLIPAWAKDPGIGDRLINARSETLAEKPAFRNAYSRRRCLILANGFYEWQKLEGSKPARIPYYFQLADGRAFTFAGLWESWKSPEGQELRSCTIITCSANAAVAHVHERMPVIFDRESCWKWLEDRRIPELQPLLAPYPADKMTAFPVSRLVNDPAHDSQDLIVQVKIPWTVQPSSAVKEDELFAEDGLQSPLLGTVLLAEDDLFTQQVITDLLDGLGFSVQVVVNGTLAVQSALEDLGSYALILMDCQMPDLDGFDAARLIRESEGHSEVRIPIIGLVEPGSSGSYENCFAAGMDDCIPKPVPAEELRQVLRKWARPIMLAQHDTGNSMTAELEDLPLDYAILDGIRELQGENEPDVLSELIGMYQENSMALIGRVRQAMNEHNYVDLRKSVHSLKGSSSTLGAHRLSEYCNEVLRLVDKNASFDLVETWLPRLEVEHARVCQALQAEQK